MINEQEMQFADPDWQPTGSLSTPTGKTVANTSMPVAGALDIHMQNVPQSGNFSGNVQGYQDLWSGHQPVSPPPSQPVPVPVQQAAYGPVSVMRDRGRRGGWWIWVVVAIIAIFLISPLSHSFAGDGYAPPDSGPVSQQQPQISTYTYALQGATELDVSDLSSNITVQINNDSTQDVLVTTGGGSSPQMSYEAQKMVLVSNDNADITISVPQNMVLHLSGGVNTLEIDGFSGLLTAQTNSGQITLNNDTLRKGSSLNTNSGNIALKQGNVDSTSITSSTGMITLNQVNLSGRVTIVTGGNGTIAYTGSLDPQGNYQFTTDSGAIDLSLPHGTTIHTQIMSKSGGFYTNIPLASGNGPQAFVSITTNSGYIAVTYQ
ncbi:MAG TPA: DUF4097 family beta strand repeat-containing protein [Ktedonobacteraceae bacterium]